MKPVKWIFIVLVIAGCGNYHDALTPDVNRDSTMGFTTLSYQAVNAIVIQNNHCLECHSAAKGNLGGVNLETYSNLVSHMSDVQEDLAINKMPKNNPPVSDYQKQILNAWAQAGAPVTSSIKMPASSGSTPPPPPPATPGPPGFDQVSAQIFQPYCARCHAFLSNATKVKAKISDIDQAITSNKMPKGGPALPDSLKAMLSDWVRAGYPDGFEAVRTQLFVPYCVRCHGSFNTYQKVINKIADIDGKITSNAMPKGGPPLPDALKQLLANWMKQGNPQ